MNLPFWPRRDAILVIALCAALLVVAPAAAARRLPARLAGPQAATRYFATYFGGDDQDAAYATAVGPDGAIYLAGETASTTLPTTGAAQATYGGGAGDGFVAKLSPDGQHLVYVTYLGGKGRDYASGIAIGTDGSAYVAGATGSPDFPMVNAFQPRPGGTDGGILDYFVAKLDPTGAHFDYSTYLGGRDWEEPSGIAVGPDGAAVVVGDTSSANFPVKGGPGLARPCLAG
jgi:hypothetical protein